MKSVNLLLLVDTTQSAWQVRNEFAEKAIKKEQKRYKKYKKQSVRVPQECGLNSKEDFDDWHQWFFLEPQTQKYIFFGTTIIGADNENIQDPKNQVLYQGPDDVLLSRGNGWCDKGVYKSWNKCNVDGECWESCWDGQCFQQHINNEPQLDRLSGCKVWYWHCKNDCEADPECQAFSFMAQNTLGHPEFTCNLMKSLNCRHDEINRADERTTFHVKGTYMTSLFEKYSANSFKDLDYAMKNDPDVLYGHWSSWGYHHCLKTPQPGCGAGTNVRLRLMPNGKLEREGKACHTKDNNGNDVVCEESHTGEKLPSEGHGWMHWGDWSRCSSSCGEGKQYRTRSCATCTNPDEKSFCSEDKLSFETATYSYKKGLEFCPDNKQKQAQACNEGVCLPNSSKKWKGDNGKPFSIKTGWARAPGATEYEGGCVDYQNAYRKVQLDSTFKKFHDDKATFAQCMQLCQLEEKDKCLAVTFFPGKEFYGEEAGADVFNCFLHDKRCHEEESSRNAEFIADVENGYGQDSAVSWYAYKDLCSAPRSAAFNVCQYFGSWYTSKCDSSGANAFPNPMPCSCPGGGDKNSGSRIWGGTAGKAYYDPETGRITKGGKFARPYSQAKAKKSTEKMSIKRYETYVKALGCHDPCATNKCDDFSTCVFNDESDVGYDCVCVYPYSPDVHRFGEGLTNIGKAGYGDNKGCIFQESVEDSGPSHVSGAMPNAPLPPPGPMSESENPHLVTAPPKKVYTGPNLAKGYTDQNILFGGGWNAQTVGGPFGHQPKPHTQYYQLKATKDPYMFQVIAAPQHIPAPSPSEQKGKFYNCMVNIAPNRVMVVGGRPGQSFNLWDDKTFVYEWAEGATSIANEGKWIGTDGQMMDDRVNGCYDNSESGCSRPNDWPDLPTMSVLNCQGQCRFGEAGRGPTDPKWIKQYCRIQGKFYSGEDDAWVYKSFDLCQHRLKKDPIDGVEILGRDGLWSAEENPDYENNWVEYVKHLKDSAEWYWNDQLVPSDIDQIPDEFKIEISDIDGNVYMATREKRWKLPLPNYMINPILGPINSEAINMLWSMPYKPQGTLLPNKKEYMAPGQPLCGLMGNKVFVGAGKFAKLTSLDLDHANNTVWKLERGSEFPYLFKRSDGSECLQNMLEGDKDKFPNFRQNFGTTVTSEGMWMIGGLVLPSADLVGRELNLKYNVEGCTKNSHFDDVWLYNPLGWDVTKILGNNPDLIKKYENDTSNDLLPYRMGYATGFEKSANVQSLKPQDWDDFRLSDIPGGKYNITIDSAIDEGWECTGVSGKWCRKPFLPRPTKGTETVIMCFEYDENIEQRNGKEYQRRPRFCSVEETANSDNNCICYIVNVAGQSGPKQSEGGSGFRPEVDFLEIRRADGTFGSDLPFYTDIKEWCPDAEPTYPGIDPEIQHNLDSAVHNFDLCTSECGGDGQKECNRFWRKSNLRRKWHEAGRIRNPRMGFLSGILQGEIVIFGGECYGQEVKRSFNPDGSLRATKVKAEPGPCGIKINKNGMGIFNGQNDYLEAFSILRMNKAGYIFGDSRKANLVGLEKGKLTHDEAAVSQAFNAFNTNSANFFAQD